MSKKYVIVKAFHICPGIECSWTNFFKVLYIYVLDCKMINRLKYMLQSCTYLLLIYSCRVFSQPSVLMSLGVQTSCLIFTYFLKGPLAPVHSPRWRLATSSLTICPSSIFLILLRFQLRILTKIRGSHENHVRAANCKFVIKGQKSKDN